MDAKIPKLPWMSVDDHAAICRHVEFSNDYNKKYKNHPLITDFASDSMIKFLYGSFIRFNPDAEDFNIFRVTNRIYQQLCYTRSRNFKLIICDKVSSRVHLIIN